MHRHTKTALLAVTTAAAVSGIAVSANYLLTKGLMDIALNRQIPVKSKKGQAKLMGSEEEFTIMEQIAGNADILRDKPHTVINLTAGDGTSLTGHWFEVKNAKRILIAMHGWRSSWCQDFGSIADFWQSQGCSVLYAEQRGQGNSGGDYMSFGLLERFDCLDWIKWVNENTNASLPIYLLGISMGASTVLMASELNLPSNVVGIGADCGFTSPEAIWKHVAQNNLRIPYGLHRRAVEDLCRKKINLSINDYSATQALANCKVPVLFIHGTADSFVPIEMTYQNYKACSAPKRLFVVPDAEHGMSYLVDREGYEKETQQFWETCERRWEEQHE